MSELNLATLLDSSTESSLLNNAALTKQDDEQLRDARRTIRERLREGLPKVLRDPSNGNGVKTPKFFTQGSWSYKTIIRPLRPPQQADLDDGVYLSIKDFKATRPSVASAAFIEATDAILGDLAKKMQWGFKNSNPNCTRLIIATDKHVDVPRYCMPDAQHALMVEKAALRKGLTVDALRAQGGDEDDWGVMPMENVLLAHRHDGWIKSDPRPISEWIDKASWKKGEHFLKVIKILKSWRDFILWPNGKDPKSILIMALVDHVQWQQFDRRIDKTLLHVVRQMPALLGGPVMNPAAMDGSADEPDLSKKLDEDGIRDLLRGQLAGLARELDWAMQCGNPDDAIRALRSQFGNRIPNEPSRIGEVTAAAAPVIQVAQPPIRRTQAG